MPRRREQSSDRGEGRRPEGASDGRGFKEKSGGSWHGSSISRPRDDARRGSGSREGRQRSLDRPRGLRRGDEAHVDKPTASSAPSSGRGQSRGRRDSWDTGGGTLDRLERLSGEGRHADSRHDQHASPIGRAAEFRIEKLSPAATQRQPWEQGSKDTTRAEKSWEVSIHLKSCTNCGAPPPKSSNPKFCYCGHCGEDLRPVSPSRDFAAVNEHKEAGLKKMQSFTPEGLGGFAQPPSPYQPAEARALSAAVLPAQPSQVAFARGVPHAAPSVVAERSARPTRDLAVESARVPPALDKTKMARKQNQGLVPFAIQVFMSDHVDRTLTEKTGFPLERFPDRWAQRFEWASNLKARRILHPGRQRKIETNAFCVWGERPSEVSKGVFEVLSTTFKALEDKFGARYCGAQLTLVIPGPRDHYETRMQRDINAANRGQCERMLLDFKTSFGNMETRILLRIESCGCDKKTSAHRKAFREILKHVEDSPYFFETEVEGGWGTEWHLANGTVDYTDEDFILEDSRDSPFAVKMLLKASQSNHLQQCMKVEGSTTGRVKSNHDPWSSFSQWASTPNVKMRELKSQNLDGLIAQRRFLERYRVFCVWGADASQVSKGVMTVLHSIHGMGNNHFGADEYACIAPLILPGPGDHFLKMEQAMRQNAERDHLAIFRLLICAIQASNTSNLETAVCLELRKGRYASQPFSSWVGFLLHKVFDSQYRFDEIEGGWGMFVQQNNMFEGMPKKRKRDEDAASSAHDAKAAAVNDEAALSPKKQAVQRGAKEGGTQQQQQQQQQQQANKEVGRILRDDEGKGKANTFIGGGGYMPPSLSQIGALEKQARETMDKGLAANLGGGRAKQALAQQATVVTDSWRRASAGCGAMFIGDAGLEGVHAGHDGKGGGRQALDDVGGKGDATGALSTKTTPALEDVQMRDGGLRLFDHTRWKSNAEECLRVQRNVAGNPAAWQLSVVDERECRHLWGIWDGCL